MKKFNKIYVEITNKCNLNCSFCSKDKRKKKELTIDEFREILAKINNYTKTIYLHIKGEPLLHSNLDEILSLCDQNNINVKITTNGTLLNLKKDILKKYKIKQLNVSLHCENSIDHYFDDVFTVCDELSENVNIVYRIWVLNNMKLDTLSTKIVDKIIDHYQLSTDVLEKVLNDKNIKIANNIYLDKDNEFIWPNESKEEKNDNSGYCLGTKSHIGILSDGTVVPCCLDSDGIINLGNIFEQKLEDIMNGKLFKMINEGFKKNQVSCDLCRNCVYRQRFIKKK